MSSSPFFGSSFRLVLKTIWIFDALETPSSSLQDDIWDNFQDVGSGITLVVFKKTLRHILQDYEAFLQDVEGINSEAFHGTKAYNATE